MSVRRHNHPRSAPPLTNRAALVSRVVETVRCSVSLPGAIPGGEGHGFLDPAPARGVVSGR